MGLYFGGQYLEWTVVCVVSGQVSAECEILFRLRAPEPENLSQIGNHAPKILPYGRQGNRPDRLVCENNHRRTSGGLKWYSLAMAEDDAIAKLARQIDATHRAERFKVGGDEIADLRLRGASELHRICADFTSSVNGRLPEPLLDLSPPAYSPEGFRHSGANLIQIASQGRQLQITFEAPERDVSTEKFPVPYVLEGEIRTYNQAMLERFEIRSRMIFFCIEQPAAAWRFFDWRTRSTGVVGRDLLVSLMGPLF